MQTPAPTSSSAAPVESHAPPPPSATHAAPTRASEARRVEEVLRREIDGAKPTRLERFPEPGPAPLVLYRSSVLGHSGAEGFRVAVHGDHVTCAESRFVDHVLRWDASGRLPPGTPSLVDALAQTLVSQPAPVFVFAHAKRSDGRDEAAREAVAARRGDEILQLLRRRGVVTPIRVVTFGSTLSASIDGREPEGRVEVSTADAPRDVSTVVRVRAGPGLAAFLLADLGSRERPKGPSPASVHTVHATVSLEGAAEVPLDAALVGDENPAWAGLHDALDALRRRGCGTQG